MFFNSKIIKKIGILVLAGAVIVSSPLGDKSVKAADSLKEKYVKEVVLSYGKTEKEARQWLKDNGYKVLDGDINAGTSDGGNIETNAVLLGYKTTSDRTKAITDMALMNMSGGYSITDMEEVIRRQNNKLDDDIDYLIELSGEYKDNYKRAIKSMSKGGFEHAAAIRVHNILNKYIETDSGKGMGDIFLEGFDTDEKKQNLKKIFIQANSEVMGVVQNTLAMATGDDETNWLKKISTLNKKKDYYTRVRTQKKSARVAKNYIDEAYGESIDKALEEMDEISERIKDASEVSKEINEKYDVEKATDEQIKEYFGVDEKDVEAVEEKDSLDETLEKQDKVLDCTSGIQKAQMFTETISVITYLASVSYGKETLLDFFTRDSGYYEKGTHRYELGAIFEAMTDVEKSAFDNSVNLFTAIKYGMEGDEKIWKGKAKTVVKSIDKDINDIEEVSIYEGVKREMFEGGVAVTQAGQTQTSDIFNSQNSYKINAVTIGVGILATLIGSLLVVAAVNFTFNFMKSVSTLGLGSTVGYSLFSRFCRKIVEGFVNVTSFLIHGKSLSSFNANLIYKSTMAGGNSEAGALILQRSKRFVAISTGIMIVLGVAVAAIGIYFSAKEIWKIIKDKKESYNGDYSMEIPAFMVDISYDSNGEEDYSYYEAVKCNRNDSKMTGVKKSDEGLKDYGDIHGDTGKQWVALYTSTDKSAGNPILAETMEIKNGDVKADDDYKQAHTFNEPDTGFNLTSIQYAFSDEKKGTYLRYKVETDSEYYKSLASAGDNKSADTSSAFSKGNPLAYILLSAVGGFLVGYVPTQLISKKKKEES